MPNKHSVRKMYPKMIRGIRINPENKNIGYVYVLDLKMDNLFKIGKTVNPESRMQTLRAANPRASFTILQRIEHHRECEKFLHKMFGSCRKEREVFTLNDEHLTHIRLFLNDFAEKEKSGEYTDLTAKSLTGILKQIVAT